MGVSDMRIRYTLMKSHIKVFSIIHYTVIEENNLKYNRKNDENALRILRNYVIDKL